MKPTERSAALLAAAEALARDVLPLHAAATDHEERTPVAGLRAVQAVGLADAAIPDAAGSALTLLDLCRIAERLGAGCPSTALCLIMHWTSCLYLGDWVPPLAREADGAGIRRLRDKVFAAVRARDAWISNCYGEPGSGAAIHRPFTQATPVQDAWIIDGVKFGTMADHADLLQFHARVADAGEGIRPDIVQFVTPASAPGIKIERISGMVGVRGAAPFRVTFSRHRIPDEDRFGAVGLFDAAAVAYPYAALLLSAPYLGLAQASLDGALRHLSARVAQGAQTPLLAFPHLRHGLADLAVELEAARALLYRAAEALPYPPPAHRRLVEAAKVAVARMVVHVTSEAMRLCGARMLMRHFPLERMMRDSHAAALHPPSIPESLETIADSLAPAERDTLTPRLAESPVEDDLPRQP